MGPGLVTALAPVPMAAIALLSPAAGDGHGTVANVVLALAVILTAAKIGGDLATRAGQPAVLGELAAGVLLGNLHLAGVPWFQPLATDPAVDVLAQIGVLILLFQVGLESTVRDMLKVGLASVAVAVLGVITPFALGWGVGAWLMPDRSPYTHAFLGATLAATSVGITARVLGDLGKSRSPEARVILGAAVIDDVLGLVILAIVSGSIEAASTGQQLATGAVVLVLAKALVFLGGALALGVAFTPVFFRLAARLRGPGVLLVTGLVWCFVLSYAAWAVGLAPIVGAYAAGLILEDTHSQTFASRESHGLEELVQPLATLLAPVFFVLMGMRVGLAVFTDLNVVGFAAVLTLAAVIGKQACSLGAFGGLNRLAVGIGMIPRGEVGLIFASIGLSLSVGGERIVEPAAYSAIVIMVIATTMATPPLLKWSFGRRRRSG